MGIAPSLAEHNVALEPADSLLANPTSQPLSTPIYCISGRSTPVKPQPGQEGSAFGFLRGMTAPDSLRHRSRSVVRRRTMSGFRAARLRVSETSSRR